LSRSEQLKRLEVLAGLMLDARLTDLQSCTHAREETLARLAGLAAPAPTQDSLPQVAAELAALNYQRWADARRAELNQILARQTAAWLDARGAAQQAFGKTQALAGVATKLAATRSKPR
jgi:hypothetical protein